MALPGEQCWDRLRGADHGVLATAHHQRGVDAVPVVFIVDGDCIVIPIDTVKAKSTTRLRRLENVAADARVVVLAEHYDDDWTQLWWVRANGRAIESALTDAWAVAFAKKYAPYRAEGAIASVLVVTVESITGWTA
jgi:PPOX class probable F420-dependent enzyme